MLDISKDKIELAEGMRIADVDFPASVETLVRLRLRARARVRVKIKGRVRASPSHKPDQGLHARGKVDVVDAHALSELDLALGDVEHALLEEGGDEALGEVGVASRPLRDRGGERVLDLRGVNRE